VIPLRDRARWRWQGILPAFGIHPSYLTGKNGPCPMCEGKDRWRFLDAATNTNNYKTRRPGDGTWICTHCGAGSGTDLVMRFTGMPFREAAQRIESIIGSVRAQEHPKQDEEKVRASLRALWRNASPVSRGDATDLWLRSRGIELEVYPPCLRTGRRVRYYNDALTFSEHPAMLAIVSGPDGKPATIFRTYLARDGNGKAAVEEPRKLRSPMPKGSAIHLAPPSPTLGVAEGTETAFAAQKLFGIPTWSAICTYGVETFEPPPGTDRLVIFGDNDRNHAGQKAAETLAARLSGRMQVEVEIPTEPGTDWNDVLDPHPRVA